MIYITLTLFIALMLFLLYGFLIYIYGKQQQKTNFVITSTKELITSLAVLIIILGFFCLMFLLGVKQQGFVLDPKDIFYNYSHNIGLILDSYENPFVFQWFLFFLLVISIIILLIFVLVIKTIMASIKRVIIASYVYSLRFSWHKKFISWYLIKSMFFNNLLYKLVIKLTKNEKMHFRAIILWPHLFYVFENNVYRYLLPYLIYFDLTFHGKIIMLFMIAPWFYIYSLLRHVVVYYFVLTHAIALNYIYISRKLYGG